MNNLISLKEFRQDVTKYAERVNKGESLIIMKHSKPFFRMEAIGNDDGWETVVDFTKFKKGGMLASEVIEILENL